MDHLTDVNLTTLHAIRKQHELPNFVKSASIDRDAVDQLPPGAFADVAHRQFPCHTRADTWLSYAYFVKNARSLDRDTRQATYDNLRKFADHWGIRIECNQLEREHEKAASEDIDELEDCYFAIVEDSGGERYRALPLLNSQCVKAAAEHLKEYSARYPLAWRIRAAERIMNKAAELQVEIELPYIHKAAGQHLSSATDIAQSMYDRATFIDRKHHGDDVQLALVKSARALVGATLTAKLAGTVASLIDKFDDHFDIKRFYARGLPTPEEIIFGSVTVKEAAAVRDGFVTTTTGNTYSKSALVKAGLAPYGVLGNGFLNAIRDGLNAVDGEKLATIVPTLPRDDAMLLDRALLAVGVKSAESARKEAGLPEKVSDWSRADWEAAKELAA